MPLPDLSQLNVGTIVVHFETNASIDLRDLSLFFKILAEHAQSDPRIGPDATISLVRYVTGSGTAWIEFLNAAGSVAGVAEFGIGLAILLRERSDRKLCRRIGELLLDNDVVEMSISVREQNSDGIRSITMNRSEIPAVSKIANTRESVSLRDSHSSGWGRGAWSEGTWGGSRKKPIASPPIQEVKPTGNLIEFAKSRLEKLSGKDEVLPPGSSIIFHENNLVDPKLVAGLTNIIGRFEKTSNDLLFFVSGINSYTMLIANNQAFPRRGVDMKIYIKRVEDGGDKPPVYSIVFLEPATPSL